MWGFDRQRPLVAHIDDEDDIRQLLKTVLNLMDIDTIEASDGPSGLALVKRMKPDLVLLDIRMPGADGFEICHKIKKTPGLEAVPIIMLSALSQFKDVERAMSEGADGYLVKPIDIPQFKAKIAQILKLPPRDSPPK